MRVHVLGAGVFGAASALELRRRGHEVVLWDPDPPHPLAASTDISKVVRADYGSDRELTELGLRSLQGWRDWNRDLFDRPLFHEEGFLLLCREPMRPGGFEHDSFDLLEGRCGLQRLAAHPRWRHVGDGYFNPRGGWAESGEVVRQLVERAVEAGAELRRDRGDLRAISDPCVVAAGVWTPSILPELAGRLRVIGQPVQHFLPPDPERWRAPAFPTWAHDISKTGWYGFPAIADGRVKVANHGAGVEVDPEGPRPLPEGSDERFRAFLAEHLPELAAAPKVDERLCLYSDSFDGDFFIDRVPGREQVFVASGGSGHGFKFAPVLGGLVADLVEGGAPHPRFAWRELGARRTEEARSEA